MGRGGRFPASGWRRFRPWRDSGASAHRRAENRWDARQRFERRWRRRRNARVAVAPATSRRARSRPTAGIANLPLVELPAEPRGPLLAIVLSGDGGWRDVDRAIAQKLQSDGVSVVGWDSLRYFWSKKSPEQTARDLGAVIDTYTSRWGASRSHSSAIPSVPTFYPSPMIICRLRQRFASFSCHSWDLPRRPISKSPSPAGLARPLARTRCQPSQRSCRSTLRWFNVSTAPTKTTAHARLTGKAEIIRVPGGHHFDNDYGALAQTHSRRISSARRLSSLGRTGVGS